MAKDFRSKGKNKILKRKKKFSQKFNKRFLVFKIEETGIKFFYREMEL